MSDHRIEIVCGDSYLKLECETDAELLECVKVIGFSACGTEDNAKIFFDRIKEAAVRAGAVKRKV